MAKTIIPVSFLSFMLLLLFFYTGEINLKIINAQQRTWCVAKPSATERELQENMNFACNHVSDCKIIQEGCSCYEPDTIMNHASVVMNPYYQINGRNDWACNFSNSALITLTDPSYGNCNYNLA